MKVGILKSTPLVHKWPHTLGQHRSFFFDACISSCCFKRSFLFPIREPLSSQRNTTSASWISPFGSRRRLHCLLNQRSWFPSVNLVASLASERVPEQVRAVVLLNSAGQFQNHKKKFKDEQEEEESTIDKFLIKPLKETIQRIVLRIVFWQSKQPSRIRSVLKSVYPNSANVDDYLVESIIRPAEDPNAGEVYYRLMTRFLMNQTTYTLDAVLSKLSCPILLLWGELDPWVDRTKASKIMEFYPNSTLVSLPAGHCPHDEVPGLVNEALVNWLASSKL